ARRALRLLAVPTTGAAAARARPGAAAVGAVGRLGHVSFLLLRPEPRPRRPHATVQQCPDAWLPGYRLFGLLAPFRPGVRAFFAVRGQTATPRMRPPSRRSRHSVVDARGLIPAAANFLH